MSEKKLVCPQCHSVLHKVSVTCPAICPVHRTRCKCVVPHNKNEHYCGQCLAEEHETWTPEFWGKHYWGLERRADKK